MIGKTGIWSLEEAKEEHRFDVPLVRSILDCVEGIDSAVDLGCGPGYYCKFMEDCGISTVKGYEGTANINEIAVFPNIEHLDLSSPANISTKYNLSLSLEVGEHIPKQYMDQFIDNVVGFSNKYIILSWAIPGQGGCGHVNELDNKTVIDAVESRGFKYCERESNILRDAASLSWFKNTLLFFSL